MCLHDTLYSAANTKLITNAKIRVRANLNRNDLTDEVLDKMLEKLPAIFYFSSVDEKGIEFAHKTVAEYFTAVKLYEDYLEKPCSHKAHELLHTHYTKRNKF